MSQNISGNDDKVMFQRFVVLVEKSAIVLDQIKDVLEKMTDKELFDFMAVLKENTEASMCAIELLRSRGAIEKVCNSFEKRSVS